ncbi:MAG: exopolysaccharide biosynthesis polyprenyl glycosylphosphotransferase [Planctomycetota bacterium]|jgi:exopolysaccharide biosynthesis polyprenyl glycosylphosphotransferase
MAITDATRASHRTSRPKTLGTPASARLGAEGGHAFALVRRLALVFLAVLTFCVAGAWILAQPIDAFSILVHWMPVAVAILASLYVVELIGVTDRPLPPITAETLFWAIATSCIVMAVGYAIAPTYAPSTALVCLAPVVSAVCVYLQRKWVETRGEPERVSSIVFARNRAEAIRALAELAQVPIVEVASIVLPKGVLDRDSIAGIRIEPTDNTLEAIATHEVALLVVAHTDHSADLQTLLTTCAGAGCLVERVDDLVAKAQGRVNLAAVDPIDLLRRLTAQANRFSMQRAYDLVFATLIAVPALVLSLLVAALVKATSRGPVLFQQTRVGRWGNEFTILKFRTMRVDAEKNTGPVFASQDDPRITPVGRFLRKTRLDELPQLINVVRGDMSIVGPRPERPYFVHNLSKSIPFYDARHAVRPGLTGWAQVRYSYGSDDLDARNKLAYELYYVVHRSTVFYFAVLLETVKVVLFQRGSR